MIGNADMNHQSFRSNYFTSDPVCVTFAPATVSVLGSLEAGSGLSLKLRPPSVQRTPVASEGPLGREGWEGGPAATAPRPRTRGLGPVPRRDLAGVRFRSEPRGVGRGNPGSRFRFARGDWRSVLLIDGASARRADSLGVYVHVRQTLQSHGRFDEEDVDPIEKNVLRGSIFVFELSALYEEECARGGRSRLVKGVVIDVGLDVLEGFEAGAGGLPELWAAAAVCDPVTSTEEIDAQCGAFLNGGLERVLGHCANRRSFRAREARARRPARLSLGRGICPPAVESTGEAVGESSMHAIVSTIKNVYKGDSAFRTLYSWPDVSMVKGRRIERMRMTDPGVVTVLRYLATFERWPLSSRRALEVLRFLGLGETLDQVEIGVSSYARERSQISIEWGAFRRTLRKALKQSRSGPMSRGEIFRAKTRSVPAGVVDGSARDLLRLCEGCQAAYSAAFGIVEERGVSEAGDGERVWSV